VIKCKRPVLEGKVRTIEKGANASVNGLVGPFNNAILMVGFSASAVQFKAKLSVKKGANKRILVKFLVHDDIFVGKKRINMTLEPSTEPGKGGSFTDTSDAI
jgi:hypothetical protein